MEGNIQSFHCSVVISQFQLSKSYQLLNVFFLSVCCKPLFFVFTLFPTIMVKSSSNDDLCDCAIQIIEALSVDQNIRGVLIPFESKRSSSSSTSTSPPCGLGPYFTTYPEELFPIFPFHPNLAYYYQRKQMKWG